MWCVWEVWLILLNKRKPLSVPLCEVSKNRNNCGITAKTQMLCWHRSSVIIFMFTDHVKHIYSMTLRTACLLSEQLRPCFPAHVTESTRYRLTSSPEIEMLMLSFGQEDSQSKNWAFLSLIALLAMTSCGDSARDVWSWLFRWPQTRNLSTHSPSSWNMFWTQTTPQWIINTALCLYCQHLLSTPSLTEKTGWG